VEGASAVDPRYRRAHDRVDDWVKDACDRAPQYADDRNALRTLLILQMRFLRRSFEARA
jgi:hypothetical protein